MEIENDLRTVLLWMLWHHQGAGSLIGQPIRRALGMKPTECMSVAQIAEAKAFRSIVGNVRITQVWAEQDLASLPAPRMERLPAAPLLKVPRDTNPEEIAKLEAAGYAVLRCDLTDFVSVTTPPDQIVLPLGVDASVALRCAIRAIDESPSASAAVLFAKYLALAMKP